jgi:hypothetical protein
VTQGANALILFDPEGNKVQFVQLSPHGKPLVAPDAIAITCSMLTSGNNAPSFARQ